MQNAINWILERTEATEIQWKRFEVGPKVDFEVNTLGVTFQAKCPKEGKKFFKNAYVGLRGKQEIICLVVVDLKGKWHFIDASDRGAIRQQIKSIFSGFFNQRCYINKKHKTPW